MQVDQTLTNKLYIRIRCLVPIDCIIIIIEQRKSDDTFLQRPEKRHQRRLL